MVVLDSTGVHEAWYWKFASEPQLKVSIEEAVELLDQKFKVAVARCFDKDIEYGYTSHLCDLSGGLDSRMTSWVAKSLGYGDITNVAYSKSGSDEERCGRLVAKALGNPYDFYSLDDLGFVYDLERLVRKNYGLAIYCGITGGDRMLAQQDFTKFGLEHTGQLGDVVIGSYCHEPNPTALRPKDIRGLQYGDYVKPIIKNAFRFENKEQFMMYYRGFQGILSTHMIRRNYTEAVSPFIDVDFLQFCLQLPLELRCGHRIYFKWLETKYPAAAEIPSTRKRPSESRSSIRGAIYNVLPTPLRHLAVMVFKMLGLNSLSSSGANKMNPMDYWYSHNPEMREFMEEYYQRHIGSLNGFPVTRRAAVRMWKQGRCGDKQLVLTVLAAHHLYIESQRR